MGFLIILKVNVMFLMMFYDFKSKCTAHDYIFIKGNLQKRVENALLHYSTRALSIVPLNVASIVLFESSFDRHTQGQHIKGCYRQSLRQPYSCKAHTLAVEIAAPYANLDNSF